MHKFFKQSKNATPGQSPQQPQQLGHALGQKPGALASSAETSPGSASRRPRPSLGGSAGNGSNGSGSGGSGNNRNGGEPRFEDILMDQVNSLKRLIKEMEREHARRTETLIEALSEKAEENIQLLNELEALKAKVKEYNEATANTAGRQYPDSERPFSPRPLVVSPAPEPQKQLQQQSQEKPKAAEVKIVEGAAITETAKKDEQLPPPEKECIPEDNASKALESGVDDALKKLRKELEEERQKTKMLGMSVQEYERRIVTLECKMQDSLAREQEKRFLAESNTRKYEQKIRNLEHRVSGLENQTVDGEEEKEEEEDDDDDENEDEDEGEKKEKCENEKKDEEMK